MSDESIIDPVAGVVTEGVVAATVAGGGRKRKKSFFSPSSEPGACSNCGTALHGRVCHSCGQDSDDFHRPVWSLVVDILDGLFSIDGRFWRTIPALLFRPGHITRHYLTGVRARYVQPFRLFIVTSVVFFLVVFFTGGDWSNLFDDGPGVGVIANESMLDEMEQAAAANPEAAEDIERARALLQGAQADLEATETDPNIEALERVERRERVKAQIRQYLLPEDFPDLEPIPRGEPLRLAQSNGGETTLRLEFVRDMPLSARRFIVARAERIIDNPSSWTDAMQRWLPRLVFLLLPLYALLLALLQFWRRGLYLYDHLVVSLHFHAFLFLFMTVLVLIAPLISGSLAFLIFVGWSNYYLYRLHRNVYANSRIFSVARVILLDFIYLFLLTFSLLLLLVVGLLAA
tara:strand:- start:767 stop:1975 length:1209 start_codon:yes stop_codon:yes gene_type:complete